MAGADGVQRIWFDGPGHDAIDTAAIVGSARAGRDRAVARQLDEWFAGSRRSFSLAVAWPDDLSPLGRTVLETLVERVPWGETVSYGELAELAGPAARGACGRQHHGEEPGAVRRSLSSCDRSRRTDRRLRRRPRRDRAEARSRTLCTRAPGHCVAPQPVAVPAAPRRRRGRSSRRATATMNSAAAPQGAQQRQHLRRW